MFRHQPERQEVLCSMIQKPIVALAATAAIVALGAAPTSLASAAVFSLTAVACTGGANVALCYETEGDCKLSEPVSTKCELEGEQSQTGEGGKAVLTILTTPVQRIECAKAKGSGTVNQKEPLVAGRKTTIQGLLKYEGCKISGEPGKKCLVTVNNETTQLLGTLESDKELKFVPKAASVFIEYTYTNNGTEKCPLTFLGTHGITGSQALEILNPGTPEEAKQVSAIGETLEQLSAKVELSQELTMTFTGLGHKVYVAKEA
jgi:hypothetical protein